LLKGGTLLSKVDLGFRRMSEDVDLVFPGAVRADPDHHQQAHVVLLQPDLDVDAIDPAGDVVGPRQQPPVERRRLVLSVPGQPRARHRR
jgi:hypothetical protein